jgi:pimeloyl-ACP methyl ester carboxylesterase
MTGAATRHRAAVLLVVLGLVLTACTTKGSAPAATGAPATRFGEVPSTSSDPVPHRGLAWSDCDDGFQCGHLEVPVDHADPNGPTTTLALVRRPARHPDQRIGALLFNPGGPGGSAIDLVEGLPLPSRLTDRFDIVGFDPRGAGRSDPLDCRSHLQQIYDDDPSPDNPAEKATFLSDSEAFVNECKEKYAPLLPFLGTTDVAKDMDLVRAALGGEQISYVGFSYGTSIGQEYARLFPTRVRAMVLDGVVDLSLSGLQGAEGQAKGFSDAFARFATHCERDGCNLDAPAPIVLDRVMAAAEQTPIPSPHADRPATPGVVSLGVTQALYTQLYWADLARALAAAETGDGSRLVDLANEYLHRNPDGTYESGFEIYFAVNCLDQIFPRDPNAVLADAQRVETEYPRFGAAVVNDYVRCALWPVKSKPLHPVPATTKGLPPIVVVSTTHDPATPYENGVRVAGQIPGAVLVTNEGEGHTVYAQGKQCIDDSVDTYLLDPTRPPKAGLRCR